MKQATLPVKPWVLPEDHPPLKRNNSHEVATTLIENLSSTALCSILVRGRNLLVVELFHHCYDCILQFPVQFFNLVSQMRSFFQSRHVIRYWNYKHFRMEDVPLVANARPGLQDPTRLASKFLDVVGERMECRVVVPGGTSIAEPLHSCLDIGNSVFHDRH